VAAKTREEAAAPDVAGPFGDASGNRIIALSATPALPAPEVSVPDGNLSARISVSPEGTQPGTPGGAAHGDPNGGSTHAANGGAGGDGSGAAAAGNGNGTGGGGHSSGLPAGVSISGGSNPHPAAGGGKPPSGRSGGLILKPLTTAPHAAPGVYAAPRTTPTTRIIESNTPPEKILWDKQVYTLNVDMPNLTSASGSWILKFAQLEDDKVPPYIKQQALSGPVPVKKVDPKYPPELIQAHVEGEVILYAIIRKDGTVDSIQLVRGLDPALDANSMNALAGWKFRPAMREGQAVELETVVHIPFRFLVPGSY